MLNGLQLAAGRVILGRCLAIGERQTGCFGNPGTVPPADLLPSWSEKSLGDLDHGGRPRHVLYVRSRACRI